MTSTDGSGGAPDRGDGAAPTGRVWASQWYRITPRSFVHEELFFDPDRVLRVFAGESYKSFLLRRDGREDHAHELGDHYRSLPADRILAEEDHEAVPIEEIDAIRLSSGSLLRKPKLVLAGSERDRTYYHVSRTHDVASLASRLSDRYAALTVTVDGEKA